MILCVASTIIATRHFECTLNTDFGKTGVLLVVRGICIPTTVPPLLVVVLVVAVVLLQQSDISVQVTDDDDESDSVG